MGAWIGVGAKSVVRAIAAAGVVATLILGGSAGAHASPESQASEGAVRAAVASGQPNGPSPSSGPEAGGTTVTLPRPEVPIKQLTGDTGRMFALLEDGQLFGWGRNSVGELGLGTDVPWAAEPRLVEAPAGVRFTQLAAGEYHTVAIGSDGNTYRWGEKKNQPGSLWTPTTLEEPAGVRFTQISAGSGHALALGDDGKAYAWGRSDAGVLGNGSTAPVTGVVQIVPPEGVSYVQLSAGDFHSVGLGDDGKVYSWGVRGFASAGGSFSLVPERIDVPGNPTIVQLRASSSHTLLLDNNGNAYAWGFNDGGVLGDGTTEDRDEVVSVVSPPGVRFTSIDTGTVHSFALGDDGNVYSWGHGHFGQLGLGANVNERMPQKVLAPEGVRFTLVGAGDDQGAAVGNDGRLYTWGLNVAGALGNGTTVNTNSPGLANFTASVLRVTFDGIGAEGLRENADGSVTVESPAHSAGPVEVAVEWELNGVPQTPVVYDEGFTYLPPSVAPTITDPADQKVAPGETARFTVTATGTPTPLIAWEMSGDGGSTWGAISEARGELAEAGTLTVVGDKNLDGRRYRAIATNGTDPDAVSAAATLTVVSKHAPEIETPEEGGTDGKQPVPGTPQTSLVATGAAGPQDAFIWGGAAVLATAVGAWLLASARRR